MSNIFVPGPVDVAAEVMAAMTKPLIPHRSKEYESIHRSASEKAQQLFQTKHRVLIGTHTGSGMQECGMRNLVSRDVLACVNGAFSKRWFDVAITNGKQADSLDIEWGKAISPDELRKALKKKKYEAVSIVHNETSTGVMNPIDELAKAVREVSPETFIMVDAVSSLGGVEIKMDAWDIDFILTSSQKCLALPPGLSLVAVNDRALEKAETVEFRGWYFDLLRMEKHRIKNSTAMTPAVSLIYALDFQMDRILAEGIAKRYARHKAVSDRVYEWAEGHGMSSFAEKAYRSRTVATINNSLDLDIPALNAYLKQEYDMCISNGYGDLKGKTFRIATMGETDMDLIEELLSAIDNFISRQK